jgi:hypothetical protein
MVDSLYIVVSASYPKLSTTAMNVALKATRKMQG